MNSLQAIVEIRDVNLLGQRLSEVVQAGLQNSREVCEVLRGFKKAFAETQQTEYLQAGEYLGSASLQYFPEDAYVKNAYGWLLYDACFKASLPIERILERANIVVQITQHQDYSPFEIFIFRLIERLEEEPADYREAILYYLNKLNPKLLDATPFQMDNGRSLASKKEKWYAKQSKIRFDLKMYDTCIKSSEAMLLSLSQFHNDNDSWAKRRIALCFAEMGDIPKAKHQLEQLLIHFDNSNIYADLMNIALVENDPDHAKIYGSNALLHRAGELKHKLKVLFVMGELYELEDKDIAYSHFKLLKETREKEGWRPDEKVGRKLESLKDCKHYTQRELLPYWKKESARLYKRGEGIVKAVLKNGDSGFIECEGQEDVFFHMKSNRHLKRPLNLQDNVSFLLKPTFNRKKNCTSIEAVEIEKVSRWRQ